MRFVRSPFLVCALAWTTSRAQADPPSEKVVTNAEEHAATAAVSTTSVPQPVAVAGSVIPGLVLHGSGLWLSGDDETATRLLIAEGIGVGLTAGSLTGLALTGAARDWAGVFASTAILGTGLFGLSFLADLYGTITPEGFGKNPGGLPWGSSEVGVLSIHDPRLNYGPLVQSRGTLRSGQWVTALTLTHAPTVLHQRVRIENGVRLWGAPAERLMFESGGSHITAFIAVENSAFGHADYSTNSAEARLALRLDSEHLLPNIRGAFFEWETGYVGRRTKYSSTGNTFDDSLLLGGFGFGFYHGDPTTRGGETRVYYNHRHDGYVGGLLQSGLGSGTIGYFGIEATHFFTPTWGVKLRGDIGAAAVLGLHLVGRAWSTGNSLGFLTFD
jgi:hypothetical protein